MAELTVIQVLQRLDAPVRPREEFAQALLTSLLEELGEAPSSVQAPHRLPLVERLRPTAPRAPRPGWSRWTKTAVAVAAALALAIGLVIVPRGTTPTALAVMREARSKFAQLPAFHATTMRRMPGTWLHAEVPRLEEPVPDLVYESDISYVDPTHFRTLVTGATWDASGPRAVVAMIKDGNPQAGEFWAADGQYFVHYLPSSGTYTVEPVEDGSSFAYFSAGMLNPDVEYMADPGDAYIRDHCEVLPDEAFLGRTVHRLHCQDPDFRQYEGGPALDVDTYIDAETGMLLKFSSRNEGVWFEATSLDLEPGPQDVSLAVPEGASIQWLGDGAPPEGFRAEVDATVTSIPVGNVPERIAYGAGSIWVVYTKGGTGGDGEGGRQAVARIDPATNEVTARIVAPTELTEIPKGWASPLVFVQQLLPTDGAVYIAYHDAGNGNRPVRIAAIDPATNELGPPILTLDRSHDGFWGAPMALHDGPLWVCDTQGGEMLDVDGQHRWPLGAMLEVDPASGAVRSATPIDGNCGDLHVVGDSLWFLGSRPTVDPKPNDPWMERFLFSFDTTTHDVARYPMPAGSAATAYGDGEVWIVDYEGKLLNRFDVATGEFGEPIETGVPIGNGEAALAYGAGLAWETNSADNTLLAIDPSTVEVVDTIKVGASPLFLTVAEGSVWVANYRDATVSRVQI
jgi:YVTN family beta-propeller protein